MRVANLLAGMLAAALPTLAQAAGVPPSQDKYAINLRVAPGVPNVVSGQVPFWIDTTDTGVNPFGLPRPVSDQSRLPVADPGAAAFGGVVAVTPGVATAAQRSLGFICTSSGSVTLTMADGSVITLGLIASPAFQSLPFAVTNVALGAGTAGSFWGLK